MGTDGQIKAEDPKDREGASAQGGAYVLGFDEIDSCQVATVGGKGAALAALTHVDGVRVPPGFCLTTDAFRDFMTTVPGIDALLARLVRADGADRAVVGVLSAEIRGRIEATPVPDEVAEAISAGIVRIGAADAFAVRSSATAEDAPTMSFAGQHDSFLNVVGAEAVVRHVRLAWASLFTERAVAYRLRSGLGERAVEMAVVVQQLASAQAAGVLFTADPVTGNRRVSSVEAGFGLGEALVAGRVNTDGFRVRDGEISERAIATKALEVRRLAGGGTQERAIDPDRAIAPALTDDQVLRLAALGRHIEAALGCPQDIEWCLADDEFAIVQSRPITTLYPVPVAADDAFHVYVSTGHQQMMTDAMKPLGISVRQRTAMVPMHEAGGRLFVDVARTLSSAAGLVHLRALGESDPLIGDALRTVIERGLVPPPAEAPASATQTPGPGPRTQAPAPPLDADRAVVAELVARSEASVEALEREIDGKSGAELIEFLLADLLELKRLTFEPRSMQVIMAAMEATTWLNDRLAAWLGETNAADALTQSVPDNITSEMGLALLGVADVIRPFPAVIAYLERVTPGQAFLVALDELDGGPQARAAVEEFLGRHGMRCVGEIDITRPRWSEQPATLVPLILTNVRSFEAGAGQQRFERGEREAARREEEILRRLRALPDGAAKAVETARMIRRLRTFSGYREYPKYAIVSRYAIYKRALLQEADRLFEAGVLREPQDLDYLALEELLEVIHSGAAEDELVTRRKEAFAAFQRLVPPRVFTSDGETIAGTYRRDDVPDGALAGLAVSGGTIEGRARVITDLAEADLEPGDILVTPFTDPSWTPVFVMAAGLVTEVGGLMTHGAVIAREYGLPAVVGVEEATSRIRDGQRIRVNGTDGYVEILA